MSRTFASLTLDGGPLTLTNGAQLVNGTTTIILPSTGASATLVDTVNPQALTNKTLTDPSNTITANAIRFGTSWTGTFADPAPVAGQVLTATTGGANATVQWQTPSSDATTVTANTVGATSAIAVVFTTATASTSFIEVMIAAFDVTTPARSADFKITRGFFNAAGTVAILPLTLQDSLVFQGALSLIPTPVFTTSGANVQVTVTGTVGETIKWTLKTRSSQATATQP